MARRPILGLFEDPNYAAEAGDALQRANISPQDYDFLTDAPYPEGAFGERHERHRLYVFPFIGAMIGLAVGNHPHVYDPAGLSPDSRRQTHPVSCHPMAVITYESTMLSAIIFTIIGILFEARLPKLKMGTVRHSESPRGSSASW